MGCTWCRSTRVVPVEVAPSQPAEDTPKPEESNPTIANGWESGSAEEQNTSGTVSHNTNISNNGGESPPQQLQPTTADACVETDFVYVHYENYKDKFESASEKLQELEDERVQMIKTHAVELESIRMECQHKAEQVRENQKVVAESEAERKKHLEIIESLRTGIKSQTVGGAENQPTIQQQQTVTCTSNESPTPNDTVVEETVSAPTATGNDVRIEIKDLLNSWARDNNGESEEHTSTVTGDTVQQLTTALTPSTRDYLQVRILPGRAEQYCDIS